MTDYGNGASGNYMPGDEDKKPMTRDELRAAVKPYGCTVRETDGEIRVRWPDGSDYYTTDRQDALDTVQAEHVWALQHPK